MDEKNVADMNEPTRANIKREGIHQYIYTK